MLCMLPDRPLFKVNPVTGLDVPYNIKPEPPGMFVTLLEILYIIKEKIIVSGMDQEQSSGRMVNKFKSNMEVFVCVHACRITHAIDNYDNNGSNNIGHTAENASNLSLSNTKNIDQINHLVTGSDDTDIEDNLESNVLSNLETVDKDEENVNNKNNENEHNNQENIADETQNYTSINQINGTAFT